MNFPLLTITKTRVVAARWWLIAQFVGTAVLLALSIVWLRLPDKQGWQVSLTLALPILLVASWLWLQSSTLRSLVGDERRVKLIFGAMTLVAWILVAWVALTIAFDFEDKIELYAGYLNSRAPVSWRAQFLTEEHIATFFNWVEWVLVYILIPGIFIPLATLTSVTGAGLPKLSELKYLAQKRWWISLLIVALLILFFCRSEFLKFALLAAIGLLPLAWQRIRGVWRNWRWWPVVLVIAYAEEHLLPWFFHAHPHGTTRAQLWAVIGKTAGVYFFLILGWLILLIWSAVLLNPSNAQQSGDTDEQLVPVIAGGPDVKKSGAEKVALS